jgi:hypothetical protein
MVNTKPKAVSGLDTRKARIPAKRYAIVLSIPTPKTCPGAQFADSPTFGKGSGG